MTLFCQAHGISSSSFILHTSSFGFYDLRGRTNPAMPLSSLAPGSPAPLAARRHPLAHY
jgi:hypothetical protein